MWGGGAEGVWEGEGEGERQRERGEKGGGVGGRGVSHVLCENRERETWGRGSVRQPAGNVVAHQHPHTFVRVNFSCLFINLYQTPKKKPQNLIHYVYESESESESECIQ